MTGESQQLVVPLDQKALGEFIVSLLGQRRSIERGFRDRRFEIDIEWLINLNEILSQRINSQHEATIVSFSAKFYFDTGKIVTVEDLESFRTYSDISTEASVGADVRWGYLIKFPLAGLPEKQEIRFAAFTDRQIIGGVRTINSRNARSFLSLREGEEWLYYSVGFTNVTWGEDISATLSSYISGKTEALPRWKSYIRNLPVSIGLPFVFSMAVFTSMIISLKTSVSTLNQSQDFLFAKYGDPNNLVAKLNSIDKKLEFLVVATVIRFKPDFFPLLPFAKTAAWCAAISCLFGPSDNC